MFAPPCTILKRKEIENVCLHCSMQQIKFLTMFIFSVLYNLEKYIFDRLGYILVYFY